MTSRLPFAAQFVVGLVATIACLALALPIALVCAAALGLVL